jgi:hypothetical protein
MISILFSLQVIMAFGLLNVWIFRLNRATNYRGGAAKSLKQEFEIYGLPGWFFYVVGFLKLTIAVALLIGIWIAQLVPPAVIILTVLMLGAIIMHIKVRDPIIKSMPAFLMLVMCLFLLKQIELI